MSRLLVHVEGETEETFANELLGPYLHDRGYSEVTARLMGNARQRSRRGGIKGWAEVRKDILGHLIPTMHWLTRDSLFSTPPPFWMRHLN